MDTVSGLITTLTALAVALGAYAQFVLRRAIYPCVEIELDIELIGRRGATGALVGELVLLVRNLGPGVGAVATPEARVLYSARGQAGREVMEPSLTTSVTGGRQSAAWFNLTGKERLEPLFLQSGVSQWYRRPFQLPNDTELVGAWIKFDYVLEVGRPAWALARWLTARPPTRHVQYTARRIRFVGMDD